MTAVADPPAKVPRKKSKLPLVLGLVLLIAGGGGGFMAVKTGFLGAHGKMDEEHTDELAPLPELAFVALDPLVISLPNGGPNRYLKFSAQLEVVPAHQAEVEAIKPRVVDVLNGYLRAVQTADLEDPTALMRLRSQMLRRVQVVAGEGRVQDLLIMEFVLN